MNDDYLLLSSRHSTHPPQLIISPKLKNGSKSWFETNIRDTHIGSRAMFIHKYFRMKQNVSISIMIVSGFLIGSVMKEYNDHKDLRIKERGRCDAELTQFGKCLEDHPHLVRFDYKPCEEFLEAYKRCLRG